MTGCGLQEREAPEGTRGFVIVEAWPAWSRDGSRIAYVHRAAVGERSGIYVLGMDGATRTDSPRLVLEVDAPVSALPEFLTFSPDGGRVAFIECAGAAQCGDVGVVDIESGDVSRFDLHGSAGSLDWSPIDENRLLVCRTSLLAGEEGGISFLDMATGAYEPVRLASGSVLGGGGFGRWRPDGRAFVYSRQGTRSWDVDGQEVFRFDVGSEAPWQLTTRSALSENLAWWQGGRFIVFWRTPSRERGIHTPTAVVTSVISAYGDGVYLFPQPAFPSLPYVDLGYFFAFDPTGSFAVNAVPDDGQAVAYLWIRDLTEPFAPGQQLTLRDDYDGEQAHAAYGGTRNTLRP